MAMAPTASIMEPLKTSPLGISFIYNTGVNLISVSGILYDQDRALYEEGLP